MFKTLGGFVYGLEATEGVSYGRGKQYFFWPSADKESAFSQLRQPFAQWVTTYFNNCSTTGRICGHRGWKLCGMRLEIDIFVENKVSAWIFNGGDK